MNARALLYSSSPNFRPRNFSSGISVSKKCFGIPDFKHRPPFHFRIRLQTEEFHGVFGVSVKNSARRGFWKVSADVKSEPYEISESVPDSVKFNDAVLSSGDDAESPLPWWEEFPKRWVIVILCFSAFLLCNMDRVYFLFFS